MVVVGVGEKPVAEKKFFGALSMAGSNDANRAMWRLIAGSLLWVALCGEREVDIFIMNGDMGCVKLDFCGVWKTFNNQKPRLRCGFWFRETSFSLFRRIRLQQMECR